MKSFMLAVALFLSAAPMVNALPMFRPGPALLGPRAAGPMVGPRARIAAAKARIAAIKARIAARRAAAAAAQ